MSLAFAVEPLAECWSEMVALAQQHWQETQAYRHDQPFNPIFERYNQYAAVGWFVPFTVRDQGRMVGYGGLYIVPSMHTQETIANEDTWFLLPEYRKGWNAVRFFRFMEAECRRRGAVEISLTIPHEKGLDRLLERLAYTPVASVYSKNLRAPPDRQKPYQPTVRSSDHVCPISATPA